MKGQGETWAVVVAGGQGRRMGLAYNKVFYRLNGRAVLSRCLDALSAAGCLDGIVLVLNECDQERYEALARAEGAHPLVKSVARGGETRQQSVLSGLKMLPVSAEIVAVHDAARPFVTAGIVRAAVESARQCGSGVAATRVKDTIKVVNASGRAVSTPDRALLRAVQTPQAFRRDLLLRAYQMARDEGYDKATDDAALVERYIGGVHLVESEEGELNLKLTTQADIDLAKARLSATMRTGFGCDAHRLVEGRPLVLCGVDIPFEKGLLGHSDADAALHALMDALLGAAALGDIGRHFPDSDERYRGVSSMKLLQAVVYLLRARGLHALNVDLTIVAQRPKLAPYMPAMADNVARVLGVDRQSVNVKATTTEGMGFEGRGEGVSATAVALITG